MANRTLELTLTSAKDLRFVNLFTEMEVYAVVSVDPRYTQRTAVDRTGGSNPAWNQTFRFSIPAGCDPRRHVVRVLLRSERALGDSDIGEVQIPLSELVDGKGPQFVSYQVSKPNSSKARGFLNISYKFGDSIPAVAPSAAYSYSAGAGAPYPPPSSPPSPVQPTLLNQQHQQQHQQHRMHHHHHMQQHHHHHHMQQHHHHMHHHIQMHHHHM